MGTINTTQRNDQDAEILEMKRQIESLKDMNQQLIHELNTISTRNSMSNLTSNSNNLSVFNSTSRQQINQFIEDKILSNSNINIKYLPDYVERQLYRNVMNIAIGSLEAILNTITINILGHTISINIQANDNKVKMSEDETETE